MKNVFVSQRFDPIHDKRYEDVIAPALRAAGVEPYRVDRDLSVLIPSEAIKNGIRNADVFVADLSEDYPNVLYEIGQATGLGKPVIILCSEDRPTPMPFDLLHHFVLFYRTDAPRDFEALSDELRERIAALLPDSTDISSVNANGNGHHGSANGLKPRDQDVLTALAAAVGHPRGKIRVDGIHLWEDDSHARAQLTVALAKLEERGLVGSVPRFRWGSEYYLYFVTPLGLAWLDEHDV